MIKISVRKALGDFTLDASLTAPTGITAVFGRSGSGKTSLINGVAGLLKPDDGSIAVDGTVLFDRQRGICVPTKDRRVGYVFQDARLFPHMTVERNLSYGGSYDWSRIIEMLGLGDLLQRMPASLSGGEKQRVALGRALMCEPRILLMDEPLAALDAPRKAEILPYLARLRDETRVPILYVSHDVSEVARLATTVAIMERGQIIAQGPVGDVLADPAVVPLVGVRAAGAVIQAKVAGRLLDDGLTEFAFSGGRLLLPGQIGQIGQTVRLRIPAQDVILSRKAPEGMSALNVLCVCVTEVTPGHGPGVAVGLRAGNEKLLARVTRRSAGRMELAPGQEIFAIIKATAVGPEDVGA